MFEDSQLIDAAVEFPELAAAVAGLPTPEPGGASLAAGARVRALLTLKRQLEARLVAELACFDTQGLAGGYGFASTASWLRAVGCLDHAQAARMVGAARTLAVLPQLGGELAAGRIGVEHVDALTRHTGKVPLEEVAVHDKVLTTLSVGARPHELAAAGRAISEVWRHDLAEQGASRLREARRLDFSPTFDGLWHVDGLLPVDVGAQLATLVEPLARPRGQEDDRTPTQRRVDAFAELLDTALRHAPLPDVAGERPRLTLIVQAGDPAVLADPGAAGAAFVDPGAVAHPGGLTGCTAGDVTDEVDSPPGLVAGLAGRRGLLEALVASGALVAAFSGGSAANLIGAPGARALSPETLARLACEANTNLAVVDDSGNVLNLGRSSRFPNLAQRRALVVRDRGCVFPRCDRPPAACIAHHLVRWSDGGATDLDNLALVCHYHHHVIHEDGWVLTRLPPTTEAPHGGWQATSAQGLQLTQHRQPAA